MIEKNKLVEELKQKYMLKFTKDFLKTWIEWDDSKVILENENISCIFWKWTTNQIRFLNLRLWNYWPFMISDSRFTVKNLDKIKTVSDFYKEFKKIFDESEYKWVLIFYHWFQDSNWNEIELFDDKEYKKIEWMSVCHEIHEKFYVLSDYENIEDYIVKNIKQKRRANYRKVLKDYWNKDKYETVIKKVDSIGEIEEFENFCFESFIDNKFWERNYMRREHNRMFYRFCYEEWYEVILFKLYDIENWQRKLIWCEYSLKMWDILYCLFWYEDTQNYNWSWVYLILKEIEYAIQNKDTIKYCEYWNDDCWYKKRMWMSFFNSYLTYLAK